MVVNGSENVLAIDVGSHHIKAVIAKVGENRQSIEVLGYGECSSNGFNQGKITKTKEASYSIKNAVNEAMRTANIRLDKATVSISATYTQGEQAQGFVNIHSDVVGHNEINAAIRNALYNVNIQESRYKKIHTIPYLFKIDDHTVEDPMGMGGSRLEVFIYVITIENRLLGTFTRVVEDSGIRIQHLVVDGYATALSVINEDEKRLGVATINMGGSTCTLSVSKHNGICYHHALPLGGNHITADIYKVLQTDMASAEKAKVTYTSLHLNTDINQSIPLPIRGTSDIQNFSIHKINEIVLASTVQMFLLIKKTLENSSYFEQIGSGLVLTGGMAKIEGIRAVCLQVFKGYSVRVAKPLLSSNKSSQILSDEAFSAVTGLLLYACGQKDRYEIGFNEQVTRREEPIFSNPSKKRSREVTTFDINEDVDDVIEPTPNPNPNKRIYEPPPDPEESNKAVRFGRWLKRLI